MTGNFQAQKKGVPEVLLDAFLACKQHLYDS